MTVSKDHPKPHMVSSPLDSYSGLKQWKKWFIILSSASFVILVATFSGGSFIGISVDILFYFIIFGVAGTTLWHSFKDARFIHQETELASQQVKDMDQTDDLSDFIENAKPSMFRTHIASLYAIFYKDTQINQDNLIELLHHKLLARNRLLELFAGLLTTLGLIGTIVGLIIMMAKMQGAFTGEDMFNTQRIIEKLLHKGGALSGLDTAFYTTLLGAVFGGVVLRILTNVVESNITQYVAHIAELTEVHVLPSLRSHARILQAEGFYEV